MHKLSLVILNWNGWKDTVECLKSIKKYPTPDSKIFVVDNGSSDESVKKIEEWSKGKKIKLIKGEKNLGFTGGNNLAIREILKNKEKPNYIAILNNDTVVGKDSIKNLIKFMDKNKEVGIASPLVFDYYHPKSLSREDNPGKFNLKKGGGENWKLKPRELKKNEPIFVDYTCGSCWVVRKEAFEKAGLFNEDFFMYGEEIDLAIRVNKKGYKFAIDPSSKIWHKVAASSGKVSGFRIYYSTRNMIWLERIHASKKEFSFFLLNLLFVKFPKNLVVIMTQKNRFSNLKKYFCGLFAGLFAKGRFNKVFV